MNATHDSITSSRALIRLQERFSEGDVLSVIAEEIANLQSKISQLQTEIKVLRTTAAMRDLLVPNLAKDNRYVKSLIISPSIPLGAAQGFYHLEYDDVGKPYRWTGPSNDFYLDLALDRTVPLRFTLRLLGGEYNPSKEKLICTVDLAEIPLSVTEVGGVLSFEGVLLPREVAGITRIRFLVPAMFEPEGPDPRTLGVLFLGMHVEVEDRPLEALIGEQGVGMINSEFVIESLQQPEPLEATKDEAEEAPADEDVAEVKPKGKSPLSGKIPRRRK